VAKSGSTYVRFNLGQRPSYSRHIHCSSPERTDGTTSGHRTSPRSTSDGWVSGGTSIPRMWTGSWRLDAEEGQKDGEEGEEEEEGLYQSRARRSINDR
jgi:hypothetical protein